MFLRVLNQDETIGTNRVVSSAYLGYKILEIFEAIVNPAIPVIDDDKVIAARAHFKEFQV